MASLGLLTLLDDITALLDDVATMSKVAAQKSTAMADDVAVMTKVATKKTAGVLGDDLALNAEQVSGVSAARELPVVWKVAKGSLLNKCFLVPAALLISVFAPWAITPLLMIGGAFLCFEGVEKVLHSLEKRKAKVIAQTHGVTREQAQQALHSAAPVSEADIQALEDAKVKGAIRTDFILSAEIIVIALGAIADKPLVERIAVLICVALLVTVLVYGLVALIVRLDDIGMWFKAKGTQAMESIGNGILRMTPWLMRGLSFVGTLAMFLVGGGLLVHGIAPLQGWLDSTTAQASGVVSFLLPTIAHLVVGWIIGWIILQVVELFSKKKEAKLAH